MSQMDFVEWALDPKRTDEELYFAERMVEVGLQHWKSQHKIYEPFDYDAIAEKRKRRKLNPAHRATLKREDVEHAAEGMQAMKMLHISTYEDRPLRDISGLKFFPHLTDINLQGEITDLSPLANVPGLEKLWLNDNECEDLRPIGLCQNLKDLHLRIARQWPQLTGLEALPNLTTFNYHGNLLALEEVPRLSMREAKFEPHFTAKLPLRDATKLPDMPGVQVLELMDIYRLDGLERFSALKNLVLGGPFRDLSPLARLTGLTHLTLVTDELLHFAPLVQLPELRYLKIKGIQPQDFAPLAEAPRLHEIETEGCDANRLELATFRAMLPPWEEEFAAPEKRKIPPLQFRRMPDTHTNVFYEQFQFRESDWAGDPAMCATEGRWFRGKLKQAIKRVIKGSDWGEISDYATSSRNSVVRIYTMDAAEQLAKIVETIRKVSAESKFPWSVTIFVDLRNPTEGFASKWRAEDDFNAERERAEWENFKKRQEEEKRFREREHRLRLLKEEGGKIDPKEFEEKQPESMEPEGDDEDLDLLEEEEHPLGADLSLMATVTEQGIFYSKHTRAAAEHLMGRRADD